MERSRRVGDRLAVLLIDVDDFKTINDGLGHDAGDQLLTALAPRLRAAMRDSDTVARLGGDEFVVLCEGLRSEHDAVRMAERLATAWTVPFDVAGRELFVTASTGIAISSERDEDAATLLREADAAMYRGKEDGRGRRELYDDAMRVRARARLRAEQDLRTAFEREEFRLVYQPVVSLADGRPVAVEALLRLRASRARPRPGGRVRPPVRGARADRPARPLGARAGVPRPRGLGPAPPGADGACGSASTCPRASSPARTSWSRSPARPPSAPWSRTG